MFSKFFFQNFSIFDTLSNDILIIKIRLPSKKFIMVLQICKTTKNVFFKLFKKIKKVSVSK